MPRSDKVEGNIHKTKVSIVIPCRNEEKYIGQCLDSMVKQSYGIENIEIFVVDGCSEDNTIHIIKEFEKIYNSIRLINNPKRVAPYAMNLGVRAATGEIIIIFGAHAYMEKEYVEKCVENLKDESIVCVGGKIVNISENETADVISMAMASPFGVGNALFRYSDTKQLVDTVAFGAYKKAIFEKIGLFDEEFVRNQDDELNFRVTKSGGLILLSPDIISHYYTRGSFSKLWRQYYQYGFWKVRVIQKHKRPASIRHLIPMFFVAGTILGTAVGIIFRPILYATVVALALYLLGAAYFGLKASKQNNTKLLKIIWTFLILHCSYGLGFLEGIISFYINKNNNFIEKNTKTSR